MRGYGARVWVPSILDSYAHSCVCLFSFLLGTMLLSQLITAVTMMMLLVVVVGFSVWMAIGEAVCRPIGILTRVGAYMYVYIMYI